MTDWHFRNIQFGSTVLSLILILSYIIKEMQFLNKTISNM